MVQQKPGTEVSVRESGRELAEVRASQQGLMVTPEYVENTVKSLALLRGLVNDVLKEGRDYGSVPGIPEFLWDPGASSIIASFNCHVGTRRILHFVNDGQRLSMVLEVPLIHNTAQVEVGSGVGAATVDETKHKYRWVKNPQEWGYGEDQIKTLDTREDRYNNTVYKVINPEPSDLLNTIVKMASKRAEVDAAEGLPGAASALKELFDPKLRRGYTPSNANRPPAGEEGKNTARWTNFWSQAKALLGELAQRRGVEVGSIVHEMLGVKSMGDWLKGGKSLDDAIRKLSEILAGTGATVKDVDEQPPPRRTEAKVIPERTSTDFLFVVDLLRICAEDFGMSSTAVFNEAGYPNQKAYEEDRLANPYQTYLQIKAVMTERPSTPMTDGEEVEPEDSPF